jgi:Fic family protein
MQTIAPYASLQRYTPECVHHLNRISASLARIRAASVWPASAEALRFAAQVGTIHYSTLIEGNRLGVLEAERAARHQLDAKTRAEIELVDYVDALDLLDRRLEADGLELSEELFKAVHGAATNGLGTPEGPFMPHHEGEWRDGEAGVWDPLAQAFVHAGAPQAQVRGRMLGLIEWIEKAEAKPIVWPPAVVAGVVHYNVAEVHPFADGNGRTARLLTTAVLMRHDLAPGRLFNFDAHYGRDKDAYLAALRSVRAQTFSLETWMRYFLDGLATEYERVEREIDRLSNLSRSVGDRPLQLSEAQQRGITTLVLRGVSEFSRRDYEEAAEVGRNAATGGLRRLAEAGIVERLGEGSARRYRFAKSSPAGSWADHGGGRPREWTDERIERELRTLVGNETIFPSIDQFTMAGRRDLYNAIQRHGGSQLWAERLGVTARRRGRSRSGAKRR